MEPNGFGALGSNVPGVEEMSIYATRCYEAPWAALLLLLRSLMLETM